ncbi:MAG: alpha/beta hydrolase, partial [Pseudanabaena sp.]
MMKYLTASIANISHRLITRSATLIFLLSAISGVAIVNSSEAAETVNFRFNIFEVSVSVDDLENFSETGELRG